MDAFKDNPLGKVVFYRTYSRKKPDGTRETWPEVVDRVVRYSTDLAPTEPGEAEALRNVLMELRGFVAGRTLWAGGTDFVRHNGQANYNCAFTDLRTGKDFYDLVILLMSGAGVGFRVTRDNIAALNQNLPIRNMPKLHIHPYEFYGFTHPLYTEQSLVKRMGKEATLVVGDSREGWAEAVRLFLELPGDPYLELLHINLNSVRPLGSPLKSFGGFAAGPGPLEDFFLNAAFILGGTKPDGWTDLKALDIANLIGRMVVAGGTRRSAQIALGDWDSAAFVTAKTGTWWSSTPWRAQSNNSVLFSEKPDRDTLLTFFDAILQYGEPGFINEQAAKKRRSDFRGLNPCLAGNTIIPVPGQGLVFIAELEGKQVPVIDGNGQVVYAKAEKTGENQPLLLVRLSDGSEYKVTPWHEFVLVDGSKRQAKDLQPGDELMPPKGVEGAFGPVHDPDRAYVDAKALPKDRVPDYVLRGDKETVLAFIRGYLEADGYVRKSKTKGWVVQVVSVHKTFLQQLQALLVLLGVHSSIAKLRNGGKHPLPDGNGGYKEYNTRTTYRLVVSNPTKLVAMLGWDTPARGGYRVQKKVHVVAVEDTGERADVYCFGVPTTQSFDLPTCHSGNCAEILLRDKGVCNLVTINLPAHVQDGRLNRGKLLDTIRTLARHAVRVTFAQFHDSLQDWQKVQNEDRLVGVSFTGLDDFINVLNLTDHSLANILSWMRDVAVMVAREYADSLGIPRPRLVTTVKPEGTLSLLAGTSSGVHPAYAPYYIRRVRINKHDSVAQALRALGMEPKPEVGFDSIESADVWVFEFPVKTAAKKRAHDYSAAEQLERYRLVNSHYTEHNTSVTIYVSPEEKEQVVDWLLINWDDYVAVSFLPKDDNTYPLMPFEAIDEERYKEMVAKLPDFSTLDEDIAFYDKLGGIVGDDLDPSCATGACPVR